jgi:PilZ domain
MSSIAKSAFRTPFDFVDRKWARIHFSFETKIASEGENRPVTARMINFSEGGFLLDCNKRLRAGAVVDIDLASLGKVRGQVAWSQNGRVGGMFLSNIPANELVDMMEAERGE